MSSTLEAPSIAASTTPENAAASEPWTLRGFVRRHPWWTTTVGLVIFSVALVRWAGTRPGYDPWGWLVWGYQTIHLTLDLGGAPSWKPLTYVFTVPLALFGHYQLWLWMFFSVAVSLAGAVFAGRIAYKLTHTDSAPPYVPVAAAVFAGAAVLGMQDYFHYILSVQSDPMIVTFTLAAIDCYLERRFRWVFVLGVLACLGRPEAWPFLGLYSIWAWRAMPSMRIMIYVGLALIPIGWYGIPWITNSDPFIAQKLALLSPRALHHNQIIGTVDRFTGLQYLPVWIAALLATAWAAYRRDYRVLTLAGAAVAWLLIEIAFALHGWPALPRYLMEAAAVAAVLAGAFVGWVLAELPRLRAGVPRWAGVPVVGILIAVMVPGAIARIRTERKDLSHERARTTEINRLHTLIVRLGGIQHIRNCGEPVTQVAFVSAFAWYMKMDVGFVGHRPNFELHQKYPIVLFAPVSTGWSVLPWHTLASKRARCAGLHVKYVFTHRHPGGVLVRVRH